MMPRYDMDKTEKLWTRIFHIKGEALDTIQNDILPILKYPGLIDYF